MLTQLEADNLLEMLKMIQNANEPFPFPAPGNSEVLSLLSEDGKKEFIVDINRKGYINIAEKCTYQGRYQKDNVLLRLDICGAEHTNPDGTVVSGTHLHVYREGSGDRWAYELPEEIMHPDDLIQTTIDFLKYFKTVNADSLEIQTVI